MLNCQLTVANQMGFSSLLPNSASTHTFSFNINLKRQTCEFHRKHSMIGFNMKGSILYIGQAMNVNVYLAMASKSFLTGFTPACASRYSTRSLIMSMRHY